VVYATRGFWSVPAAVVAHRLVIVTVSRAAAVPVVGPRVVAPAWSLLRRLGGLPATWTSNARWPAPLQLTALAASAGAAASAGWGGYLPALTGGLTASPGGGPVAAVAAVAGHAVDRFERRPGAVIRDLALCFWCFHFAKRLLESVFVHRFSKPTMPVSAMARNLTHYGAAGLVVGAAVAGPWAAQSGPTLFGLVAPSAWTSAGLLAAAVACQTMNGLCHLRLASLRPADGRGRAAAAAGGDGVAGAKAQQRAADAQEAADYPAPTGGPLGVFDAITCPNYTFEIAAWLLFSLATSSWAALAFSLLGAWQMGQWARQKDARLRRLHGSEGARRWVMLPPFW